MTDAANKISLFKIVTERDDVIIGLSAATLAEMGGVDAGTVGKALVAQGALSAWQYNVGRHEGQLVQVASQRISVLAHSSVRVEPYHAAFPVMPPVG